MTARIPRATDPFHPTISNERQARSDWAYSPAFPLAKAHDLLLGFRPRGGARNLARGSRETRSEERLILSRVGHSLPKILHFQAKKIPKHLDQNHVMCYNVKL